MSQRPVLSPWDRVLTPLPGGRQGEGSPVALKNPRLVSGHRRARSSGRAILGPKQPGRRVLYPELWSGPDRRERFQGPGSAAPRAALEEATPEPGRQPPPPSARAEWARRPCAARQLPRPPRKPRRARGQGRRPALPSRSSFLGKRYLRSPQWPRAEHSRSRAQSRNCGATGAPSKR